MIKTTIPGVINAFLEGEGTKEYYINSTETIYCTGRWLTSNVRGRRIPFAYITQEDIALIFSEANCGGAIYYPQASKVRQQAHSKGIKHIVLHDEEVYSMLMHLESPLKLEEAISRLYVEFKPKSHYRAFISGSSVEKAKEIIREVV